MSRYVLVSESGQPKTIHRFKDDCTGIPENTADMLALADGQEAREIDEADAKKFPPSMFVISFGRAFVLVAVLAAASSAQAAMMSAADRYPAGAPIQLPGDGPWNIHINFSYGLPTVFTSVDIPVTIEDSGQAITIDESTIASYGGDWADVVTWSQGFISPGLGSNHSNGTVLSGYIHDPATIKGGSLIGDFLGDYPLPRAITEFTPLSVVVFPALSGHQGIVGVRLNADVTIIPEPTTAALGLMGLCMCGFGFHRGRSSLRLRHR